MPTLTLFVYLTGIKEHRTLYLNSLISTSIVSIVFLTFITLGLYKGWKLKDDLGNFLDKFQLWKKPNPPTMDTSHFDPSIIGESGLGGCILSFCIWILLALFGSFIFWLFGAFIWATILIIAGILYWIIFRAFRLIFRNSTKCKGDLLKSFGTAFLYTILYNCWIYAIVYGAHFLNSWPCLRTTAGLLLCWQTNNFSAFAPYSAAAMGRPSSKNISRYIYK